MGAWGKQTCRPDGARGNLEEGRVFFKEGREAQNLVQMNLFTKQKRRHRCSLRASLLQSCLTLCDPMDGSSLAPVSMGFSRQEYWSGLPWFPPGDLPDPGIEAMFLTSPAFVGRFYTHSSVLAWRIP